MFYERDKQVITLIQCLYSINAVKYWAQVTFRAGLHKFKTTTKQQQILLEIGK